MTKLKLEDVKAVTENDADFYYYRAKCIDVYDADTITLRIDVGFSIHTIQKVRLYGINAPEIRTTDTVEKSKGFAAAFFVEDKILNKDVILQTIKTTTNVLDKKGKYGRYLGIIHIDGQVLNCLILDSGHAVEKYY